MISTMHNAWFLGYIILALAAFGFRRDLKGGDKQRGKLTKKEE